MVASILGGAILDHALGELSAKSANRRNVYNAQNSYQWMMQDMEKAGLNPILASKMGPLSIPGSPMNPNSAVAANSANIRKTSAETKKIDVETNVAKIDEMLKGNLLPGSRAAKELFELVENTIMYIKNKLDIDDYGGVANKFEKATVTLEEALMRLNNLGENTEKLQSILKNMLKFSPLSVPLVIGD